MVALPYAEHDDRPSEDKIVVLHNATWADYQRHLEMRGDHSAPRIAYLEGELEIMSPSRSHEAIKSLIGRLVEALEYAAKHQLVHTTGGVLWLAHPTAAFPR